MLKTCFSLIFCVLGLVNAIEVDFRLVTTEQGVVKGYKFWGGDYYEFYGIPYAKAPSGRNRYKSPLPPESWEGILEATSKNIQCTQLYYTGAEDDDMIVGQEDCLVLNVFVPKVAHEANLRPVIVYIHSGAFALGHSNMAGYKYLVRHDVLAVSINYRLGALGFACLGNEDIPGNAGLKDQVAALKWVNKNIVMFGGDPEKVTVAGFSVGAAMAELLALSPTTVNLFDRIILESGSAISPWVINVNPIETARHKAISLGFEDTGNLDDLTNFYLETETDILALKSVDFYLKNGTFGFSPCVEKEHPNSFITKSPLDILQNENKRRVAVLTGFSNMEGLSREDYFEVWKDDIQNNFKDFLPADIAFPNASIKIEVAKAIYNNYFNDNQEHFSALKGFVDYSSDYLFKNPILKSVKLHAAKTRPVYLYEFAYLGKLNQRQSYTGLEGASHRDQTSYILDFSAYTNSYDDMDVRDRLTMMWAEFAEFENPTEFESSLINYKWKPYTKNDPSYVQINTTVTMKKEILDDSYKLWQNVYEKYYLNPKPPNIL